jgi:phosphopentomutase
MAPYEPTLLQMVKDSGMEVVAVGKIEDIFAHQGITSSVHTTSNSDGIDQTLKDMETTEHGLIFTNLVDFDMLYGHRNNVAGYAKSLKEFDERLPDIMGTMQENDLLMITADHGCDPSTSSTDHSREYVPLLVYGEKINPVDLGIRATFSDLGQTAAAYLGISPLNNGTSFLKTIFK